MDWYRLAPNSSEAAGAASKGSLTAADTPAAANMAPERNRPRRLTFEYGMKTTPLTMMLVCLWE